MNYLLHRSGKNLCNTGGSPLHEIQGQESKDMADQIMTADKRRLKSTLGQLSIEDMQSVEKAILTQLGMGR